MNSEALSPRKAIETAKVRGLTWLMQPSEDRPNPSPETVLVANRTMETYGSPAISHCNRAICCEFAWIPPPPGCSGSEVVSSFETVPAAEAPSRARGNL